MKELTGRALEAQLQRSVRELKAIRMQAERELDEELFDSRVQTEKARMLQQRRPWWKKLLNLRISITTTGE